MVLFSNYIKQWLIKNEKIMVVIIWLVNNCSSIKTTYCWSMLTLLKKYILKLYPYQGHRLNDLKPDKKSKKKVTSHSGHYPLHCSRYVVTKYNLVFDFLWLNLLEFISVSTKLKQNAWVLQSSYLKDITLIKYMYKKIYFELM